MAKKEKKDLYERFPEFREIEDGLHKSLIGQDLLAFLGRGRYADGYKMVSTGRFYIDIGSKSYIKKLEDGRWYFTSLSDGRPFSQMYSEDIESLFESIWYLVIKKRSPLGITRDHFTKWIENELDNIRGKKLGISEITKMFYGGKNRFYTRSKDGILNSPTWDSIFSFLGIIKRDSRDGLLRYVLEIRILGRESKIAHLLNAIKTDLNSVFEFGFIASPRKPSDGWMIAAESKEEAEAEIIEQIVNYLDRPRGVCNEAKSRMYKIIGGCLKYGITGEITDDFIVLLLQTPEIIPLLPDLMLAQIRGKGIISQELYETMTFSKRMGLF